MTNNEMNNLLRRDSTKSWMTQINENKSGR